MTYGIVATVDSAASGTALTITRTVTYAAGEQAIVTTQWASASGTATASDGTNTYVSNGTPIPGLIRAVQEFFCASPVPGTYTVTVTYSTSRTNRRIAVTRTTGLTAFQAQAGQAQSGVTTATDFVSTGNVTPTSQPALIFGVVTAQQNASVMTPGTGFTSHGSLASWDALTSDSSNMEHKRLTSTSAVPATWTSGGTDNTLSIAGVYTESGTAYTFSSGGTVVLSGAAQPIKGKVLAPSGLVVLSGIASYLRSRRIAASGSVTLSGTAPFTFTSGGAGGTPLRQRSTMGYGL
jgi:hypothetical protein